MLDLKTKSVGDWQTNCYLVVDPASGRGYLVDPGDEAEKILEWIADVELAGILLTHGHHDHVGALQAVRRRRDVPVWVHPRDARAFQLEADNLLEGGDRIELGASWLEVVATPGHTPGSVTFRLWEEGESRRALVGDAVFPGGPGHTTSHDALITALDALARTVFTWPDETVLHPGHGAATTVGAERGAFEAFRKQPMPPDLYGDVTWS